MKRLFISYAHTDKWQVNEIVKILRDGYYDPWFDYQLIVGLDWKQQLIEAIAHSEAFVYVLSPESVEAEWCQWQFAEAVKLGKPIIPILIQSNTSIPPSIASRQYADFTEGATLSGVAHLMAGIHHSITIPLEEVNAPENPKGKPTQILSQSTISYSQEDNIHNSTDINYYNPSSNPGNLKKIRVETQEFLKKYPNSLLDITHADRALDILKKWLLDKEQLQYLEGNAWTAFYLYGAVYLYQIGLCSHPQLQGVSSMENPNEFGKRSATLINSYWKELGINNREQSGIFSRICEAYASAESKLLDKIPYQLDGKHIDVPFIVSCLKLLYELDLSPVRIPLLLARFSKNLTSDFSDKFVFFGIAPHSIDSHSIIASFSCHDHAIHRLFKQHEGHIQKTLNIINRNTIPRFQYTNIVYDIDASNYLPLDFRFEVDASAALEIFLAPLYAEQAVFIRELIQNSLDACGMRLVLEPNYQPQITVKRDLEKHTVKIKDNGIGMDIDSIKKYLLRIGISFYHSQDFKDFNRLDVGFSPIGRFGIGILSCFIASEEILIRTKKFASEGLEIKITDFRNYFSARIDPTVDQGTEITVSLKPSLEVDSLGYMLANIKNPRFPIEYVYHNGETTIIEAQPVGIVDKLKRQFWKNDWKQYLEVNIPMLSNSSQCFIAYRKVDISQIPLHFNKDKNDTIVLQDGIFICHASDLLPRWMIQNLQCQLDLRENDRLDLSASRNDFLRNEKFSSLKETIGRGVIKLLEHIMLQSLGQLINHRQDYHDMLITFIQGNLLLESEAKLLVDLFQRLFCFKVFTSGTAEVEYCYLTELRMFDKPIDVLYKDNQVSLSTGEAYICGFDATMLLYVHGITIFGNKYFRFLNGNIQVG